MSETNYIPPTGPDEANHNEGTLVTPADWAPNSAATPPKPTAALSCTGVLLFMVIMLAVVTGPYFSYVAPIFAIPGFIVGIMWIVYAGKKNGR